MPDSDNHFKWQEAFIKQSHYASVGQMFSGILHNLNGVNQAFSLQASLFSSMFSQADRLLDKIKESNGKDLSLHVDSLQNLLRKRSILSEQMETKLLEGQDILTRCQALGELYKNSSDHGISINRIIQYELDILTSITFFKHGIKKNIFLSEKLPPIFLFPEEIHNIIFAILLNAIEALGSIDNPELTVKSRFENGNIVVEIINAGDSLGHIEYDKIFEPFFSTKKDHSGLGLYLAHIFMNRIGGTICPAVSSGETVFTITVPL